jgi:hypothetical protein
LKLISAEAGLLNEYRRRAAVVASGTRGLGA